MDIRVAPLLMWKVLRKHKKFAVAIFCWLRKRYIAVLSMS